METKDIRIIPMKSFNGIEFGISREEFHKIMGNPLKSFKKTSDSKVETDDYGYFHVYYDDNYCFEAVDVFNELDIYYNDDLLSKKYSELLGYFKNLHDEVEEDDYGFIINDCSVGVYLENDDDLVEVITFGKKKKTSE